MRIRWHNQSWVDLRWRCPPDFRSLRGGKACKRPAAVSQLVCMHLCDVGHQVHRSGMRPLVAVPPRLCKANVPFAMALVCRRCELGNRMTRASGSTHHKQNLEES